MCSFGECSGSALGTVSDKHSPKSYVMVCCQAKAMCIVCCMYVGCTYAMPAAYMYRPGQVCLYVCGLCETWAGLHVVSHVGRVPPH